MTVFLTLATAVLFMASLGTLLFLLMLAFTDLRPPDEPPQARRAALPRPDRQRVRPQAAHRRREHRRKAPR